MSWFRVDDSFPAHPKLEALGSGAEHAYAVAMWTLMGADSSARGTDGAVSRARLGRVLPWPARVLDRASADLVRVGLWIATEDGWQFHDWTHYQPTKEQREKERAATRERQRAWKEKRRVGNASGNAVTDAVSNTVSDGVDNTAPSRPVPSRPNGGEAPPPPDPTEPEETTLRDRVVRRWGATFEAVRGALPARDDRSAREVVTWLRANAANVGKPESAILDAVLEAYWREPWPRDRANRASLANLLSQLDRLLAETSTPAASATKPVDFDAERERIRLANEARRKARSGT